MKDLPTDFHMHIIT